MKRYLSIGGVSLCLDAQRPLRSTIEVAPFYAKETANPDITVHITWDWIHARRPHTPPVGHDLVHVYYQEQNDKFCELAGGDRGALACTWYPSDFREMVCAVNHVNCKVPQDTERQILRMLPMRQILLHFGTLFLHASQIAYQGRGVLFTAPSGTGKTTQAKLWMQCRNAEILCNDRTLVRRGDGVWHTYGYPVDGSEPVCNSVMNTLGAVVLLKQGNENNVERLGPTKALPLLMRQVVLDCWSGEARTAAMELLIMLMKEIPVYRLTCTPDERAVETLESKLMEDKVISNG